MGGIPMFSILLFDAFHIHFWGGLKWDFPYLFHTLFIRISPKPLDVQLHRYLRNVCACVSNISVLVILSMFSFSLGNFICVFYCFATWMLEAAFYLVLLFTCIMSLIRLTCTIFHQHIAKMKSNKNRSTLWLFLFWLEFCSFHTVFFSLLSVQYEKSNVNGAASTQKDHNDRERTGEKKEPSTANSEKSIKMTQTGNVHTGTNFAVL